MSTNSQNDAVSAFVVGVSGHRDLRSEDLPQLRAAVADVLRRLAEHLPDSELRVMAGMATGADLLVAQTALDLGFGVDALLPMPLEHYAEDFDTDSFDVLKSLLAHPHVRHRELPLNPAGTEASTGIPDRDFHYAMLTRHLVRGCSLLIALWDGEPSALPGGTADTVLRYLGVRTERNKDEEQLEFSDAAADADLPARLVYWIPTVRAKAANGPATEAEATGMIPCFLAGLGDNALQRVPAIPRRLQVHLQSLNAYNREHQYFINSWPAPGNPDSLFGSLPATLQVDPHDQPVLESIDAQYGKADALALHFQKRSDHLFAFFNIVAFVMGLAYLTYEKFMSTRLLLLVYLLILTSSVGVYHLLHERHWFAKHLMCRALAETLRVKFYLRLAHCDHLVNAEEVLSLSGINRFHGFGWIGHVLIGVEAPPQLAPGAGAQRGGIDRAWIESQCQYFVRKVAKLHRSGLRTKWLKRLLFGVIIAVVVVLLLLGETAGESRILGIPVENALTFLLGLVAVTLASWELHQNKMATRELLWQYRNQLKHFSRARAQLARTLAAGRRLEILADLGKDSLMESYLWTIHRFHREHEPPGRG
ncbi:MAG: hypothetical protein JO184_20665 [Gammaproteobacteria bacterium]|nr:hypothetical protein [Gammaproteobacteria bacterium]